MEFVAQFLLFALELVFWYFVFTILVSLAMKASGKLDLNEKELEIQIDSLKRARTMVRPVRVEEHDGVAYWYDSENNDFFVQGKTQDDIVVALQKRWPNTDRVFVTNELVYQGPDFTPRPYTVQ